MEIKQINSTIKSRAAVAFAPNQPLQIVEIDVEMPRKGEVLIRNTHTGVCHTDAFTLSGSDPEGVFPVVLGHEGAGVVVAVGEGVLSVNQVITLFRFTPQNVVNVSFVVQVKPTYASQCVIHKVKV